MQTVVSKWSFTNVSTNDSPLYFLFMFIITIKNWSSVYIQKSTQFVVVYFRELSQSKYITVQVKEWNNTLETKNPPGSCPRCYILSPLDLLSSNTMA